MALDNQVLEAKSPRTVERESVRHRVQRDRPIGDFFWKKRKNKFNAPWIQRGVPPQVLSSS